MPANGDIQRQDIVHPRKCPGPGPDNAQYNTGHDGGRSRRNQCHEANYDSPSEIGECFKTRSRQRKHKKICVKSARSPTIMNRAQFPSIGSDGSMAGIQSDPLIDAGGRQGGQSIFQKSQARSNQSSSTESKTLKAR